MHEYSMVPCLFREVTNLRSLEVEAKFAFTLNSAWVNPSESREGSSSKFPEGRNSSPSLIGIKLGIRT